MIQQLFGTITVSYQGGKIMDEKNHTLTAEQINRYRAFLHEQERAEATIQKYLRDLHALEEYLANIDWLEGAVESNPCTIFG